MDCACIGVIFDYYLVLLIILLTLDGVGLNLNKSSLFVISKIWPHYTLKKFRKQF